MEHEIIEFGLWPWDIEELKLSNQYPPGSAEARNCFSPIQWIVLFQSETSKLLLSKYAIGGNKFNENDENVTWETCTLRKFLNQIFFEQAFNEYEKNLIVTSDVGPTANPMFDTPQGSSTRDKVMIPSLKEMKQFENNLEIIVCKTTPFSDACNVLVNTTDKGTPYYDGCVWWLRTSGEDNRRATVVYPDKGNEIYEVGDPVYSSSHGVRPLICISNNN